MNTIINRDEIRRLEKAARDKDKKHLAEWARALEVSIARQMEDMYEKIYTDELANAIDNFTLALLYTLLNDSNVNIKGNRLENVMDNLFRNIDRYRTGEITPEKYKEILQKSHTTVDTCVYNHRITDIVAVVYTDENRDNAQKFIEKMEKDHKIILVLDNTKGEETQIRRNVDIINMCTRMYYFGDSEIINIYKEYARLSNKPRIEGILSEDI